MDGNGSALVVAVVLGHGGVLATNLSYGDTDLLDPFPVVADENATEPGAQILSAATLAAQSAAAAFGSPLNMNRGIDLTVAPGRRRHARCRRPTDRRNSTWAKRGSRSAAGRLRVRGMAGYTAGSVGAARHEASASAPPRSRRR